MGAKLKPAEGIVFGVQRFSVHDGPGIRTTVFLKGCNIRCTWCHNPEGIPKNPILGYNDSKCIKCGECIRVCPNGCHTIINGMHNVDRDKCTLCGKCVDICPEVALEKIGSIMTVDEVFEELKKDRKYYEENGGITLSGGEPLLQTDFALGILKRCKTAGIHCAVETNGVHPFKTYEKVMPYVDLFLFDYKLTDQKKHREYIGAGNETIMENLHKLHDAGAKVLVRCPIIAGINDTEDHFDAIAGLARDLPNLEGVEILSYHKLGISKANRIGKVMDEYEVSSAETVDEWKSYMLDRGGKLVNLK